MGIFEIILISLGLSMDACAISICKGLSLKQYNLKYSLLCGLYFGIFQGIMSYTGYLLGTRFTTYISHIDHWITLILLTIIGLNMIYDKDKDNTINNDYSLSTMIPLSIASSIDALTIGITFSLYTINIYHTITIISLITLSLSFIGVFIGTIFKYNNKTETIGGIILIFIGIKIFIEHIKKL